MSPLLVVCPECDVGMKKKDFRRTRLDECTKCGGLWFDPAELPKEAAAELPDAMAAGSSERVCALERRHGPMTRLEMGKVEIERCISCGGSFLDAGEIERLRRGAAPRRTKPRQMISDSDYDKTERALVGAGFLAYFLALLSHGD